MEAGAGAGARYADQSFADAGAKLMNEAAALYGDAEVVLKVRRPLAAGEGEIDEMALLRSGQVADRHAQPLSAPRSGRRLRQGGA